ncbi:MAG: hypothetical protein IKR58_04440 [Lachnospiraceae bacterium]|nr:hypothetical protein [Lachnospiraceae bacterium]
MSQVLDKYIEVIPVIKDALGMDIMMSITDGEKFLAYWPGQKMIADIHIGDRLNHDDPMWTSFTTGKKLEQICPATVYGFAFRAITIAIREGATIVGTMGIAISLENESFTTEASEKLLHSIEFVRGEMDGLNKDNDVIKKSSDEIKQSTDKILDNVTTIQGFAREIQKISNKTNMLALNASIEAARSGEVGKGFAVVAEEMRNLANDTKESSEKILELLGQFTNDIEEMEKSLKVQEDSQNEQAELSGKLFSQVQEIEEITKEVLKRFSI